MSYEVITHSGILGQKWHRRRYQYENGTYTEEGKARRRKASKSSAQSTKPSKPTLSSMSDDELKSATSRLKAETEFNKAWNERYPVQKKEASRLVKSMGDIAISAIDNIGKQAATYYVGVAVNKLAGSEIVNPKKGQKDK